MLFDGWHGLLRVVVVAPLAYVALVAMLRISGKRTLTRLSAFDLVVAVALGAGLATVVLDRNVPLLEGLLALALLILLQFSVTWASVRSPNFQALVKSEPTLLFHHGRFLEGALRTERVTREEIFAVLRARGFDTVDAVAAVVLETDGSITVLPEARPEGSLEAVQRLH